MHYLCCNTWTLSVCIYFFCYLYFIYFYLVILISEQAYCWQNNSCHCHNNILGCWSSLFGTYKGTTVLYSSYLVGSNSIHLTSVEYGNWSSADFTHTHTNYKLFVARHIGRLRGLTGSVLDHRSLPPVFEYQREHIWRVFILDFTSLALSLLGLFSLPCAQKWS